jgi:bifunctional DNA-binding transcriptional regulator/antitoxin component of YhaV-PrlF toxin-antitoxin module
VESENASVGNTKPLSITFTHGINEKLTGEEEETIVTVTKKGQATMPVMMRRKHNIGRKVLVIDTEAGVLLKPLPDPQLEKGSLKKLFEGMSSRDLIEEARAQQRRTEERASRHR